MNAADPRRTSPSAALARGLARDRRTLVIATACCAVVLAVLVGLAAGRGEVSLPFAAVGGLAGAAGGIGVQAAQLARSEPGVLRTPPTRGQRR